MGTISEEKMIGGGMKKSENLNLVSVRVWGDFACATRPDLKAERVSYPLLTPSAARGVLEAIYYEPQMFYMIHEIGVIKRGRWFSFRRNEVKKVVSFRDAAVAMAESGDLMPIRAGGGAPDATQRGMLALADVEYLITAEIRLTIGRNHRAIHWRNTKGCSRDELSRGSVILDRTSVVGNSTPTSPMFPILPPWPFARRSGPRKTLA